MAVATKEVDIKTLLRGSNVHRNLSTAQLVEAALLRGEARLASNGALVAITGVRTGRSVKDKFIVDDATTHTVVNWGKVNQPFDPEKFDALLKRADNANAFHHDIRRTAKHRLYVSDLILAGLHEGVSSHLSSHVGTAGRA